MNREYSARSVRQHLGAIRGLFDHLVAGKRRADEPGLFGARPAGRAGESKTRAAAVQPQEIRLLLDSIDTGDCSGLRDRALIATMAYGFARVSAAVGMDVKDCFERDGHGWLRIRDRNGAYEIPAPPERARISGCVSRGGGHRRDEQDSPLWRTMTKERGFSGDRMSRVDVFRMVKRRVARRGTCHRTPTVTASARRESPRTSPSGGASARASIQLEPGDGITPADIERHRALSVMAG